MARAEEEDAPPQLLQLFNCFWFERTVLTNGKTTSQEHSSPEPAKVVFDDLHEQLFQKSQMLRVPSTLHVRSLSDHALGVDLQEVPSPDSVLAAAKLETIFSGKEVSSEFEFEDESDKKTDNQSSQSLPTKQLRRGDKHRRRRMKKHSSSKSLSELEFKEVKGFMDLGFVFSEQDKNSADLVSIIPGSQRLGKNEVVSNKSSVPRPYLSEAWEILDRRRAAEPLAKWRVLPDLTNEMAVKDQLKFWAHAVASTVR